MTGLIGFSSGYRAMEHCDTLLMLGTDFPCGPFLPQQVPVIQVDVRGEQIGRRVPVRVPLVGTVKDTIDALLPRITAKTDTAHLDRMTAHYRRARGRLDNLARPGRGGAPLHPQHIAAAVDQLAAADAVFTADVGTGLFSRTGGEVQRTTGRAGVRVRPRRPGPGRHPHRAPRDRPAA
jgi:pyruvate dehydrogenase (quinone)